MWDSIILNMLLVANTAIQPISSIELLWVIVVLYVLQQYVLIFFVLTVSFDSKEANSPLSQSVDQITKYPAVMLKVLSLE